MVSKEYSKESQNTDRLVGVGNRLISAINLQAQNQKDHQQAIEESSASQKRHQKSITCLTIVIAISSALYTTVTIWETVTKYNQIQIKDSSIPNSNKISYKKPN